MLSKMKMIASESLCLYLYKTLMLPLFNYRDAIYDSQFQQDSEQLQKLWNAALRIIFKKPHGTPIIKLHKLGNVYKLEDRRHYHVCHQTYKILIDLAPASIMQKLTIPEEVSTFATRYATEENLVVPQVRLQMCSQDHYVRGSFYWNINDKDRRTSNSLHSFKKALFWSFLILHSKSFYMK